MSETKMRHLWYAVLVLIGTLSVFVPANAFVGILGIPGQYVPTPSYKFGSVYTRAVVLEDGYPIWVSYDEHGKVFEIFERAEGEFAEAWVLAMSTYTQLLAQLRNVQEQYHLESSDILMRDTYLNASLTDFNNQPIPPPASTDLKPNTLYVAVKPKAQRYKNPTTGKYELVLLELNVNPFLQIDYEKNPVSLLLKKNGDLLHQSEGTIGYKTAFWEDDIERGGKPYGPLRNVSVTMGTWTGAGLTNNDGKYAMVYQLPPCPGFYINYNTDAYLKLYYQRFNPRGEAHFPYYMKNEDADSCNGMGIFSWVTKAITDDAAAPTKKPLDFVVDIMALSGKAKFKMATSVEDAITFGGAHTFYNGSRTALNRVAQAQYDLDGDGIYDRASLGKISINDQGESQFLPTGPEQAEIQGIWLSSSGATGDVPDLSRSADWGTDFEDRALLTNITFDDFSNTDLYVFRESDGSLLVERRGLNREETSAVYDTYMAGTTSGEAREEQFFYYTLPIVNANERANEFAYTSVETFSAFQKNNGFVEAQSRIDGNLLRPGETVRVVVINRATGYMGTLPVLLQAAGQSGDAYRISFPIEDIILQPPNLKIWAQRNYLVQNGLSAGDSKKYTVSNEGAALSDDVTVEIITEWFDESGLPLPTGLAGHGFTGRVAKMIAPNKLDGLEESSNVAEFSIQPGRNVQVVRLSEGAVGQSHFYVQVSGEPKSRTTADFSDSVIGGVFTGRPARFVPVRVPIYDEKTTLMAMNSYILARNKNLGQEFEKPDPIYHWVYRPEFQFSIYDLDVQQITRTKVDQETENILEIDNPLIAGTDKLLEVYYQVHGTTFEPLTGFSFEGDKELVMSIGEHESQAEINASGVIKFDNFDHLAYLRPDDYLAITLYANNDTSNILWEFAFVYLGMAVDLNRDGKVEFRPRDDSVIGKLSDKTTEMKPFRFWLNDDFDVVNNAGVIALDASHCPPEANPAEQQCEQWDDEPTEFNSKNTDWDLLNTIESEKDLEDFAPLAIKISMTRDVLGNIELPPDTKFFLEAHGFGINLFMGVWENGIEYIADQEYTEKQAESRGEQYHLFPLEPNVPHEIRQSELENTFKEEGTAKLIFEGVKASSYSCVADSGDCYLELRAEVNGNKVASEKVYMNIMSPKHYYDYYSVGDGEADKYDTMSGAPHGAENLHAQYTYTPLFVDGDERRQAHEDRYVMFVHGWRMKSVERAQFAQTAFKRLYWSGYRGRFGGFTWPTGFFDKPAHVYGAAGLEYLHLNYENYNISEAMARQCGPLLRNLLTSLRPGKRLHIFAHSMGNVVVSEALRTHSLEAGDTLVDHYVPSQAAEVASAYNPTQELQSSAYFTAWYAAHAEVIEKPLDFRFKMAPNRYTFTVPDIHGSTNPLHESVVPAGENWGPSYYSNLTISASKIVNFYNDSDAAMGVWSLNQGAKPNPISAYFYGYESVDEVHVRDGYSRLVPDGIMGLTLDPFPWNEGTVTLNSAEILAHLTPARTGPLGSTAGVGPGSVISWSKGFAFGGSNQAHSAQFYYTYADRGGYWRALLDVFDMSQAAQQ